MATIKSHTDLPQSKKLAEFLPLESADMHYVLIDTDKNKYSAGFGKYIGILPHHPAWSLAALLSILPYPSLHKTFAGWRCDSYDKEGKTCKLGENTDNPVDTCVAMIKHLHELNLL